MSTHRCRECEISLNGTIRKYAVCIDCYSRATTKLAHATYALHTVNEELEELKNYIQTMIGRLKV